MERERRHVGAEHHVRWSAAEKTGQHSARTEDQLVGLGARGIGPMSVGIVMIEILGHRIHDRPGNLGAAGTIEVRHRLPPDAAVQGWEVGADLAQRPEARLLRSRHTHGCRPDSRFLPGAALAV